MLLDSGAIGLVISLEFAKRNKFKKKKLERLIYREYKERIEIDVIKEQN